MAILKSFFIYNCVWDKLALSLRPSDPSIKRVFNALSLRPSDPSIKRVFTALSLRPSDPSIKRVFTVTCADGSDAETERLEELPLCSCRMEAPRVDGFSARSSRSCMAIESINGEVCVLLSALVSHRDLKHLQVWYALNQLRSERFHNNTTLIWSNKIIIIGKKKETKLWGKEALLMT